MVLNDEIFYFWSYRDPICSFASPAFLVHAVYKGTLYGPSCIITPMIFNKIIHPPDHKINIDYVINILSDSASKFSDKIIIQESGGHPLPSPFHDYTFDMLWEYFKLRETFFSHTFKTLEELKEHFLQNYNENLTKLK